MSRILFLIGIGGFAGGIARYLIANYFHRVLPSSFPYGTFFINIIGCLAIGLVYGLSEKYRWFTPELRSFLAAGLCGGFTTFSAFAFENFKLLESRQYFIFGIYSLVSFALGLVAVYMGLKLTRI